MAYRYYSTLRPLMVGGIPFPKQPGESITTIVNFEEGRTYCKDIDRPAWGYIEYTAAGLGLRAGAGTGGGRP